ncbi:hypothetical protein F4804DRAFT_311519 [Jackrogersella minutella]|nr:hypothetical protein F4804DRAFT_311519 [Jackrogersella minutella]
MAEIADSDSPDPLSSTPPRPASLWTDSTISPGSNSPGSDFNYHFLLPSESPPRSQARPRHSQPQSSPYNSSSASASTTLPMPSSPSEDFDPFERFLLGYGGDDIPGSSDFEDEEGLFVDDEDDNRHDNNNGGDFVVNLHHPIGQLDAPRLAGSYGWGDAGIVGRNNRERNGVAAGTNSPSGNNRGQLDELVEVEVLQPNNPRGQQRNQEHHQHRAEPEVIDLTGDNDGPAQLAPRHHSQNARRQRSQQQNPPPRLSRSDASYMGSHTVIDLISDSDDEPAEVVVAPPPRRNIPPRRANQEPSRERQPPPRQPEQPDPLGLPGRHYFQQLMQNIPLFRLVNNLPNMDYRDEDDIVIMGQRNLMPEAPPAPAGPINLDYLAHPFPNHAIATGGPGGKPAHEPPKETREGFTRNTGEDVVAICPSCELELAYDPDEDSKDQAPPAKKARTKKDKAEHHFWAVKTCGHVYCKMCYENRKPVGKNPRPVGFRPDPNGLKNHVLCAVDDCDSDVSAKSAWVGIFM